MLNNSMNTIFDIIANQNLLAKFFLIISLSMFSIFAIIVSRQVVVMNNMINEVSFSPIFKMLAYINIILSIILLLSVVIRL